MIENPKVWSPEWNIFPMLMSSKLQGLGNRTIDVPQYQIVNNIILIGTVRVSDSSVIQDVIRDMIQNA